MNICAKSLLDSKYHLKIYQHQQFKLIKNLTGVSAGLGGLGTVKVKVIMNVTKSKAWVLNKKYAQGLLV